MKELHIGIKLSKVNSVIENEPDKYQYAISTHLSLGK